MGILPLWLIFSKAGFPGWYSLAALIPIAGLFIYFFLAFAKWPIEKELTEIKQGTGA